MTNMRWLSAGATALLGLLSAGSALAQNTPAASGKVVFTFRDEASVAAWNEILNDWSVKSDVYITAFTTRERVALSVYDKRLTDVKATLEFAGPGSNNHGGLLVRGTANKAGTVVSGYFVGVRYTSQESGLDVFKLTRYNLAQDTGKYENLCHKSLPAVPNAKPFRTLVVDAKGSSFRVTVNGTLTCTFTDSTYKSGKIGLQAFGLPGSSFLADGLTLISDDL